MRIRKNIVEQSQILVRLLKSTLMIAKPTVGWEWFMVEMVNTAELSVVLKKLLKQSLITLKHITAVA